MGALRVKGEIGQQNAGLVGTETIDNPPALPDLEPAQQINAAPYIHLNSSISVQNECDARPSWAEHLEMPILGQGMPRAKARAARPMSYLFYSKKRKRNAIRIYYLQMRISSLTDVGTRSLRSLFGANDLAG